MYGINVWFIDVMEHDYIFKKFCFIYSLRIWQKIGKRHQEFITYLMSLKHRLMNANEGRKFSVLTIQV